MRLYYHPFSNHSRTVRMTAALLGLELELVPVDLFAGAQRGAGYLAVNPNGKVPALDDDGFVLWESNAIAQYLASMRTTPALFPDEPRARADVARWQYWALSEWDPVTRVFTYEQLFKRLKGEGAPDANRVRQATADLQARAALLDARLAGRAFLVGDAVTLADIAVVAGLGFAAESRLPLEPYDHLGRWFASIAALDAWRATAPTLPGAA